MSYDASLFYTNPYDISIFYVYDILTFKVTFYLTLYIFLLYF